MKRERKADKTLADLHIAFMEQRVGAAQEKRGRGPQ